MKKFFVIVLVIIALSAAVWFAAPKVFAAQTTPTVQPTLAAVKSSNLIISQASVIPVQDTSLTFTASGVVSEVLIKEGQSVQTGQVLARLTGAQALQAALSGAELEALTAQQDLNSLRQNADLQRAQAQLGLIQAKKALDDAQKHRNYLNYDRGSEDQVAAAQAAYLLAKNDVDTYQSTYNHTPGDATTDPSKALALSNLSAAKTRRDKALENLNWFLGSPSAKDISEADANLAVAQAKYVQAQFEYDRMKGGPDYQQMSLMQARIQNANDKVEAANANLASVELKAPFAGTVSSVKLTAGAFAQPGVEVAKLADTSGWLVKTSDLTELNVTRIQPGMAATVKLDALPGVTLNGHVESIENFGENHQSDIVYAVVLKLDQPDPRLHWNMNAIVTFANP